MVFDKRARRPVAQVGRRKSRVDRKRGASGVLGGRAPREDANARPPAQPPPRLVVSEDLTHPDAPIVVAHHADADGLEAAEEEVAAV